MGLGSSSTCIGRVKKTLQLCDNDNSEGKRSGMNLLVLKETRRCRFVRGLTEGKRDSVCAKRSLDGQLWQRTGNQQVLEVSAVIYCEIGHAIDVMPTRRTRGRQEIWRGYFPHKHYGLVEAAAVRVNASNIPLVVGFKAMRTVSC